MDVPQTAEDLKLNKIADINANKELYNHMINNEKIHYNSVDHTFQYKVRLMLESEKKKYSSYYSLYLIYIARLCYSIQGRFIKSFKGKTRERRSFAGNAI